MNTLLKVPLFFVVIFISGCITSNNWDEAGRQVGFPSSIKEAKLYKATGDIIEINYEVDYYKYEYYKKESELEYEKTESTSKLYALDRFEKCILPEENNEKNGMLINVYDCRKKYGGTYSFSFNTTEKRGLLKEELQFNFVDTKKEELLDYVSYVNTKVYNSEIEDVQSEVEKNCSNYSPAIYLNKSEEDSSPSFIFTTYEEEENKCNLYKLYYKQHKSHNRLEASIKRPFYVLADIALLPFQAAALILLACPY